MQVDPMPPVKSDIEMIVNNDKIMEDIIKEEVVEEANEVSQKTPLASK